MNPKLLAAIIVAGGIIAIALFLKSGRAADNAGRAPAPARQTAPGQPLASLPGSANATGQAPQQALPRFLDLGTTTCAPCKVMLGVMEELRQRFPGSLIVDFINVNLDSGAMDSYGLRAIPSQIFFAPDGTELFRHTGVMRADDIVAKWAELGFPLFPLVPAGGE